MKRIFTYLFIGLFVYWVIGLFVAPPPVFAQGCDPNQPWNDVSAGCFADEQDAARTGGINQGASVRAVQQKSIWDLDCSLGGIACSNTNPTGYQKNSAIGSLSYYIQAMYENPPATTYAFVQDLSYTLGFGAKPAYAQGVGFSGLSAFLSIWKTFRNIAYLFLAIIMLVIGFMVMFRKKIDPKTVVTVQNALPKIIITLLLITFSYAIVGILIDLMYLIMLIGISLLVNNSNGILGPDTASFYVRSDFSSVVWGIFGTGLRSIDDFIRFLNPNLVLGGGATFNLVKFLIELVKVVPESALVILIVSLLLLFLVIRIFFMLLGAYMQIIVALIFAPLQLLMEAIPGSNSFSGWILNLISNLIVFPITALLILVGRILISQASTINVWTPPLLGTGGTGASAIIGLGILLVIPTVAGSVKEALKAKPMVPTFGGELQSAGGTAAQLLSTGYYIRMFTPKKILKALGLEE